MAENGEVTIVGAGARLEGNVVSAGNLRIDGNITSKTLVVEEGGIFHGQSNMDAGAGSGSPSTQTAQQSAGVAPKEGEEKKPDQVKV